jgi:hypothetical protein
MEAETGPRNRDTLVRGFLLYLHETWSFNFFYSFPIKYAIFSFPRGGGFICGFDASSSSKWDVAFTMYVKSVDVVFN